MVWLIENDLDYKSAKKQPLFERFPMLEWVHPFTHLLPLISFITLHCHYNIKEKPYITTLPFVVGTLLIYIVTSSIQFFFYKRMMRRQRHPPTDMNLWMRPMAIFHTSKQWRHLSNLSLICLSSHLSGCWTNYMVLTAGVKPNIFCASKLATFLTEVHRVQCIFIHRKNMINNSMIKRAYLKWSSILIILTSSKRLSR